MHGFLHDGYGSPVAIGGYVVPWNSLSVPLPQMGGRRELVRMGAARDYLGRLAHDGVIPPAFDVDHNDALVVIGPARARISLWADSIGLAFEITDIAPSNNTCWLVDAVARRELCTCSMYGVYVHGAPQTRDGEEIAVIDKIQHLSRVALTTGNPGYRATSAFIANTEPDRIGDAFLAQSARSWHESRVSIACRSVPPAKPAAA